METNGKTNKNLAPGWCLVLHKDIAEINPKLPANSVSDNDLVSFLPMAALEAISGKYDLSCTRKYGEVKRAIPLLLMVI